MPQPGELWLGWPTARWPAGH